MKSGIAALGSILLFTATASAETIEVAADVGYAPHIMASASGGYEGYSVDLMDELSKRLGTDYAVIDQEWSGIIAGLVAGKYVAIAAPTTVTEERSKNLLFGEPYLDKNYQFVIKSDAKQIDSMDDTAGLKIAVNKGNSFDLWLSDPERLNKHGYEVVRFGKTADAVQAVISGRADAAFDDESVISWAARQNPLLATSNLRIPTGEFGSWVFDVKNPEARARFEKVFECMKADGTVARIAEKWLGQKPLEGGAAYKIFPGIGVPGFTNYDPTPSDSGCS